MKLKTVQTSNLKALARALEAITHRAPGQPGIAIVYGPAGYGKTTGVTWLGNQCDGLPLEAKELWTPRWMLSDFVSELGASPASRCQEMYEYIVREFTVKPRTVLIDEADRIANDEVLVEVLREIHDVTNVPMILIGVAQFKKRAAHRKQLFRRIVREVEFKPATIDDARLIARELCEVELHDDLVLELHRRSAGSIGLLRNSIADVESSARRAGAKVLRLSDYVNTRRSGDTREAEGAS